MTYPRPVVAALAAWTAANTRARRDYYRHPIAFDDTCQVCGKALSKYARKYCGVKCSNRAKRVTA